MIDDDKIIIICYDDPDIAVLAMGWHRLLVRAVDADNDKLVAECMARLGYLMARGQ